MTKRADPLKELEKTVIKLEPDVGRALKQHCAAKGITMRDFVTRLVLSALVSVQPPTLPDVPGSATGTDPRRKKPPTSQTLHRQPPRT